MAVVPLRKTPYLLLVFLCCSLPPFRFTAGPHPPPPFLAPNSPWADWLFLAPTRLEFRRRFFFVFPVTPPLLRANYAARPAILIFLFSIPATRRCPRVFSQNPFFFQRMAHPPPDFDGSFSLETHIFPFSTAQKAHSFCFFCVPFPFPGFFDSHSRPTPADSPRIFPPFHEGSAPHLFCSREASLAWDLEDFLFSLSNYHLSMFFSLVFFFWFVLWPPKFPRPLTASTFLYLAQLSLKPSPSFLWPHLNLTGTCTHEIPTGNQTSR